jgi:Phosphotransferase enzyme family
VPSHGDFSPRQVLQLDGGRLAVVDFDACCMVPAGLDLATYASYFVRGGAGDTEIAEQVDDESPGRLRPPSARSGLVPVGGDPATRPAAVPPLRRSLVRAGRSHGRRRRRLTEGMMDQLASPALLEVDLKRLLGAPVRFRELKHKPGRRRTLRAHGSQRAALVKLYGSERAAQVAARIAALADGPHEPRVPRVPLIEPHFRALVLSDVPGAPISGELLEGGTHAAARAGAALGRWHLAWRGKEPAALRRIRSRASGPCCSDTRPAPRTGSRGASGGR